MLVTPATADFVPYPLPRQGTAQIKILVEGEIAPEERFTLRVLRLEGFEAPRHRHVFSQVRYMVRGDFNYAPGRTIREGQVGFFPMYTYYGPEVDVNCDVQVLQYGKGYLLDQQRRHAMRELRANGVLEKRESLAADKVTTTDQPDNVARMYELIHGKPMQYGNAAYDEPVIMDPKMFPWRPLAPGVDVRSLGVLGTDAVEIKFLRFESGASTQLQGAYADLISVMSGGLRANGELVTSSAFSPKDEAATLQAVGAAEIMVIRIPVH